MLLPLWVLGYQRSQGAVLTTDKRSLTTDNKALGPAGSKGGSHFQLEALSDRGRLPLGPLVVQLLSQVRLFATPRTTAHQALLSMGFSGKNTGVGCHALLQIFPDQGSNACLLHGQAGSPLLSHQGSPGPPRV